MNTNLTLKGIQYIEVEVKEKKERGKVEVEVEVVVEEEGKEEEKGKVEEEEILMMNLVTNLILYLSVMKVYKGENLYKGNCMEERMEKKI